MFAFFDPHEHVRITCRNLPHWFQPGATYFITFRTEDSLPADVVSLWRRRRDDWLRRHGIDPAASDWQQHFRTLAVHEQDQFHLKFSEEYLAFLDKGYGECVLRRRDVASKVAQTLEHFDGQRYYLGDFVIMPNHVHLLVGLLGETDVTRLCYSWKKYSAQSINRLLGRRGRLWQEESFDHLVRNTQSFERFRWYIARNGQDAGLRTYEYYYRSCPHLPVLEANGLAVEGISGNPVPPQGTPMPDVPRR